MPDQREEGGYVQGRSHLKIAVLATGRWCVQTFDVRDAMLAIGLLLLAIGLFLIWLPAALIVPGAIISAVAIFANRINGSAGEG